MKPYYVALTGSKNNAGDFLIKHRAMLLMAALRPDRDVIDMNAWIPIEGEALQRVNGAQALILLGGPALQRHMYPAVYAMTATLDAIRVPILTMGIGWKAERGDWRDSYNYPFSGQTMDLLNRIKSSGLHSSVRDFHTLNTLSARGFDNYLMTGCPAYYDLDAVSGDPGPLPPLSRVAFSLGVSFVRSAAMEKLMKEQILRLRERFKDSQFEVVFHHSLDPGVLLTIYGKSRVHSDRHLTFVHWLEQQGIAFVDISGSANRMIDYYRDVDLHVGYRVHAHILMASWSKLSVLIAEDGRGRATGRVMGGMLVDGFSSVRTGRIARNLARRTRLADPYTPNHHATSEILGQLGYELASGGHRRMTSRAMIDSNFQVMRAFLAQLP